MKIPIEIEEIIQSRTIEIPIEVDEMIQSSSMIRSNDLIQSSSMNPIQ